MKIIIRLFLFVVSISYCGITHSQTNYVTLTSIDFVKGLDNLDYLRGKLIENGFTISRTSGAVGYTPGFYESWQFETMLYVDIIYKTVNENTIKVGVHETFNGFPERLIQSFPHKKTEKRTDHIEAVNIAPTNKAINYSLTLTRDSDSVTVFIWFDKPYYFFEYKREK